MNTHLDALELRLSNERIRLSEAKTKKEIKLRQVWIAQIEKEIQSEKDFIGIDDFNMSDDELLAELLG